MTRDVITVGPRTPFKDIADLLVEEAISAVPVVDRYGSVLGVVAEADLLCKEEQPATTAFAGHRSRERFRKAAGLTAADIMSSPALTVTSTAGLPEVARRLTQAGVRRLLVVDSGLLVGVVARRDLLRTFLRSDQDIRAEIDRDVFGSTVHANMDMVLATVAHGEVMLTGRLEYEADVATVVGLCRDVPGVVAVRNRLDYQWQSGSARTG